MFCRSDVSLRCRGGTTEVERLDFFFALWRFLCVVQKGLPLLLCLFRRKMVSVVKWFQGSHFSGNHFLSKGFFGVWRVRKIANIFLYFYSIILTYKNQFLFTT
jgi:hypothetical protein